MGFLYFIFECIAFLTCLLVYKQLENGYKWFLPFLSFIVTYELANRLNKVFFHKPNAWCNNLESIVELLVYGFFIASLDKRKNYRDKVYILLYAGTAFSLIDIFFIQGFFNLATIAMVLQSLIIAVLVCHYFYRLISENDENNNLLINPAFYIATGLLFYTLTGFIFFVAYNYLSYSSNSYFYLIDKVLTNMASVILYLLFSVAFLCIYRNNKLVD